MGGWLVTKEGAIGESGNAATKNLPGHIRVMVNQEYVGGMLECISGMSPVSLLCTMRTSVLSQLLSYAGF